MLDFHIASKWLQQRQYRNCYSRSDQFGFSEACSDIEPLSYTNSFPHAGSLFDTYSNACYHPHNNVNRYG